MCAVILYVMCAALRKFGIFIMTFSDPSAHLLPLLETKSVIVLCYLCSYRSDRCDTYGNFAEFLLYLWLSIMGGVEAGMALPFVCGMTKIGWIGYVMSAAIAVIGIVVQTMMQSRKIGKKERIFSKEDQRTGIYGV